MISKKLLSEVLGDEYKDRLVDWFQVEDNYLRTYYDCGKYDLQGRPTGLGIEINIYELAHKCKVWADGIGYTLFSNIEEKYMTKLLIGYCEVKDERTHKHIIYKVNGESEPEAIFQACQWILNNKENK